MFKLSKTKNGFFLECESINDDITNNIVRILMAGDMEGKTVKQITEDVKQFTENKVDIKPQPSEIKEPVEILARTGERLPNPNSKANTVDLGDVQNAKPTYYKYFRCPKCAQSVLITVDGKAVVRDITGETSTLYLTEINEELSEPVVINEVEYMALLDSTTKDATTETLLGKVPDLQAHCPVCASDSLLNDWIDAFENPLSYSENEKSCPMCGSEACINVDEDQNKVMKCENKDCGYILKEEVQV